MKKLIAIILAVVITPIIMADDHKAIEEKIVKLEKAFNNVYSFFT